MKANCQHLFGNDIDTSTVHYEMINYSKRKPIYTEMTDPIQGHNYGKHI